VSSPGSVKTGAEIRSIDVSLMSIAIFLQQLFTIAHQSILLARWQEIQLREYQKYLEQWKNPDASYVYHPANDLSVEIMFAVRKFSNARHSYQDKS
jgi:hypothetical protein